MYKLFFIHKWDLRFKKTFHEETIKEGDDLFKRLLQESLVPEDFSLCDDVGQKTFLEGMSCARKFSWGDVLGQKTFLERMFGPACFRPENFS